jgi:hypothetical protein
MLFCLALLASAGSALAQQADAPPPLPKPGKPHAVLAQDAGTWDCVVKMYFGGPDAPPSEFKGVEENKLVSGNLYLLSTFRCTMGDRGDFEGHGLMGYDVRARKYTGTWVDNFTAAPSPMQGDYDEKTKTLTVHSAAVDAQGNEMKSRMVTTWRDDGTKQFTVYLVVEAGGKETLIKLMEMTGKKRR